LNQVDRDHAPPLDNRIVERLHVRAALTRKNFLFAGSDAGGDRAAIARYRHRQSRFGEQDRWPLAGWPSCRGLVGTMRVSPKRHNWSYQRHGRS
jgi:hypothetical protein